MLLYIGNKKVKLHVGNNEATFYNGNKHKIMESYDIINFYVLAIRACTKTIEDVPEAIKEAVQEQLE